jgi:acetylserotonin N-methyltransferase
MAKDFTQPDPAIVLDLIEAFRRSKTMFAAVSLGAFDALAGGAKTLAELAAELKANQDALERLLDACVGLQLLEKRDGKYENTAVSTSYLTKNSPGRLTGYINYSNDVMWKLWSNLEDAVREGTHRWKQAFGWDGPIFSHFFRDEAAKREFLMGMHGYGLLSSPHVVGAFDLSQFRTLADLGGATGHLAVAACKRYPHLRAVVFDLPDALPLAWEIVNASPVSDRISIVAGDFFNDPLPVADLFALGRILHDWTEEKILKLLGRILERLPQGGALLIAEKLLSADKRGPRWAQMQNLNMLTCTEGKERTLAEYEVLLRRAGFGEFWALARPRLSMRCLHSKRKCPLESSGEATTHRPARGNRGLGARAQRLLRQATPARPARGRRSGGDRGRRGGT